MNVNDLDPFVKVNTMAARDNAGLMEREIRRLKEKIRATTSEFQSVWILICAGLDSNSLQLRLLDKRVSYPF